MITLYVQVYLMFVVVFVPQMDSGVHFLETLQTSVSDMFALVTNKVCCPSLLTLHFHQSWFIIQLSEPLQQVLDKLQKFDQTLSLLSLFKKIVSIHPSSLDYALVSSSLTVAWVCDN